MSSYDHETDAEYEEMKKVEKFVEDKTFGLKNKNKSMNHGTVHIVFR